MRLTQPTDDHCIELMSWFSSAEELGVWSGPGFGYPFDLISFRRDIKLDSLKSFSLISSDQDLLAFGQYYLRFGRCHLGRLVVNPCLRGQGIVAQLIAQLSALGNADLDTDSCSLFVVSDNQNAIRAYLNLGFTRADYPGELPLDNCFYMVKESINARC